ncbi:MAG: PD40 domain-containing protein [Elusimicrobia bacterium]|nr:PD40 domain-containing protein [Elusimicrobiota bacterium]
MRFAAAAALWALLPALAVPASGQDGFGTNHVVLRDFQWKVRSTEHFDIHYYEDSEPLVGQAAEVLERSYRRISEGLGVRFTERRPFFLYASVNHMQQSNIVEVGDGTGGVTEAFKDRFMIYHDGSRQWLDAVGTHELVHVFQYSVLVSGFWRSARILKAIVYPLWMMEGMAEHFTHGLDDSTEDYYLRDAATSGGLIPLWKLEHFSHLKPHQVTLAYKSGATVIDFVATQYGKDKVGEMLKLFESRFESSAMLQDLLGLDIFAFDRKWREHLVEKFGRVAREERLQEPTAYGVALTTSTGDIPEFNTSAVYTPDGRRLAYLSTREGHPPAVILKDLRTGKRRRLVDRAFRQIENIELGRFVNISRVMNISPDGRTLVFTAQKNHRESLYFYDLEKRRLRKVPLPGFLTASSPAFSPDGRKVAFAGMKGAITDLYLLDVAGGGLTRLTEDPADDQTPVFSPDGRSIVFSSELVLEGDPMPYQRRLCRLDLDGLQVRTLLELPGSARDPYFSRDGRRLLFALERGGFHDIHELDLESGRVLRLTRSFGAAFTPVYSPEGDVTFSVFRRNNVHVYRGRRPSLLAEAVPADYLPKGRVRARPATPAPAPGVRPSSSDAVRGAVLPGPVELARLPGLDLSTQSFRAPVFSTAPMTLSEARPYRFQFSTDLFLPALFYSSQGGLFALGYWQGSDLLGNHNAAVQLALNTGQGYYNYQTQYAYRRWRPQLSAVFAGLVARDRIDTGTGLTTDQSTHLQLLGMAYPLDRYHRLEAMAGSVRDTLQYDDIGTDKPLHEARLTSASFVRDTVGGRYLVATYGSRLRLNYVGAHPVMGGNTRYRSVSAVGHQFVPTGGMSALAFRVFAARSQGPDAEQYFLGGIGRLRGYGSSTVDNVGNSAVLGTAEWRFPVWKRLDYYMWYLFPDFYFKAITGAVFGDAGYAWTEGRQLDAARVGSLRSSYGVGLRVHTFILQLFPLVIHFDYARETQRSTNGIFYVYLGPLF